MKKFASLLLALVIVFSLAVPAAAQEVDSTKGGKATITIQNAALGVTYKLYKLFDATVNTTADQKSIAYTGTIPTSLATYFTKAATGNEYITVTDAGKDGSDATKFSSAAVEAMKTWAAGETPLFEVENTDGKALVIKNLPYGLYVITSTQNGGAAITVDSTFPDAVVFDKNPTITVSKSVDDPDVYIGQEVEYTAVFATANYLIDANKNANKITKYVIHDTLPAFLKNVTITSLIIDNDGDFTTTTDQTTINVTEFVDTTVPTTDYKATETAKGITLDWVDASGNHLYANTAKIQLVYTAKVTAAATVDGAGNRNVVTLQPYTDTDQPWQERFQDDEVIFTYAAALKKVDTNKKPLAGAKFSAKGLTVTGSAGKYTVTAYDSSANAADGTIMETDDEGNLVILGLQSDKDLNSGKATFKLTVTETEAPAGYNKLVDTIELPTAITGKAITASTTTVYYDADGNVTQTQTDTSKEIITYTDELKPYAIEVVNKAGTELPTTGGTGTTLFYVIGGGLMLAAFILLITKKRMAMN